MIAKVLVQSDKVNTYVNIIVALCRQYPEVKEVRLSFLSDTVDEDFIDEIQRQLVRRSENNLLYAKGARVHLSGETRDPNDESSYLHWDVIDVTGVSKEIAVNVAAAALDKRTKVCNLVWNKQFEKEKEWIVEEGNHSYNDLMSNGALSQLYRNYFRKKQVLFVFLVLFAIIMGAAIAKIIWPSFIIPADLVNLFSLLIGAAGLYLAAVGIKGSV